MSNLIIPVHEWDIEKVNLLITHGTDLDIQDKKGQTALIWICYSDDALISARYKNNTEIVKMLIRPKSGIGSNLDIQAEYGQTALMCACYKNNIEISKILINKGSNLDIQDKNGNTALMWVCCTNHNTEIVKILIKKS